MTNPAITDLPPVPTRNDAPAVFVDKADAFLGALPQFQAEANALGAAVEADAGQTAADRVQTGLDRASATASASSALNAPGTSGTSTTSLAVAAGTKSFTTQAGKAWSVGQGVVIASTASPLNQMSGVMTAYNASTGAMTVEVSAVAGSGTFATWTVSLVAGAALALASQAEAEAGTDPSKVMTPLRTAQAITKQTSAASMTAPNSALTAAALSCVLVTTTVPGQFITLPDATTLLQGRRFSVANLGPHDLILKNNAGVIKAFIRPFQTGTAMVSDVSTAAGAWAFEDCALVGLTADLMVGSSSISVTSSTTQPYPATGAAVVQIDADRELIAFTTDGGTYAVVYNRATQTWGALIFLGGPPTNTTVKAVLFSANLVLVVMGQIGPAAFLTARTLSISGVTITANTVATANTLGSFAAQKLHDLYMVGSTAVLTYAQPNGAILSDAAVAMTVSGTTVTIGAPIITAAITSAPLLNVGYIVGSTLMTFSQGVTSTAIFCVPITVSGSTLTLGTATSVGCTDPSTNGATFQVHLLPTGRWVLLFNISGVLQAALVSLAGTVASATAAAAIGAVNISTFNQRLAAQVVGSDKVVFAMGYTASVTFGSVRDNAGTLVVSATFAKYTRGFVNIDVVASLGVSGTDAWFFISVNNATHGAFQVHKIDCSGTNLIHGGGQFFERGSESSSPGGFAYGSPDGRGTNPPFQMLVSPAGSLRMGLGNVNAWFFAPQVRRIPVFDTEALGLMDTYASHKTSFRGATNAEVWNLSDDPNGAGWLSLKKTEMVR